MARKISKAEVEKASAPPGAEAEARAAADAARQAAEELATLHPDLSIRLRDRVLTLREYRGIEGLNLQATTRPLLDGLYALFAKAGPRPTALQVREVMAQHATTVQWLIAQSATDYPQNPGGMQAFTEAIAANFEFVGCLDDVEFDQLLTVWWGANGGFFTRRFREKKLAESQSASSGSTEP